MFADDAFIEVGGLGNYRGKAGVAQWVGQAWGWPGLQHGQRGEQSIAELSVSGRIGRERAGHRSGPAVNLEAFEDVLDVLAHRVLR